jgi:hypothetical protein
MTILSSESKLLPEKPSQEEANKVFDQYLENAKCIRTGDALYVSVVETIDKDTVKIHSWGAGSRIHQYHMILEWLRALGTPSVITMLLASYVKMKLAEVEAAELLEDLKTGN